MKELPIGGVVPFTATDYPGCLSLVVFCRGCPWKCHYCHNPHLQSFTAKGYTKTSWKEIVALLKRRKGLLDAVVFSGGEPTVHKGLLNAIKEARSIGFKVGLHTGGGYPEHLKAILPFVDWVGFDIKAPFEKYETITQIPKSGEKARICADMLLESGVPCEFRTTVHPKLLSNEDLEALATTLKEMGVKNYVLQEFRPEGCASPALKQQIPLESISDSLKERLSKQFNSFLVR